MAQPNTGWLATAPKEQQDIYILIKTFLDSEQYTQAQEHINRVFELQGGDPKCIEKGYHELFWIRGEVKSKLNDIFCFQDFLQAFQLSNPKKIEYIKRAALECKKQYHSPSHITLTSAIEWVQADPNDLEANLVLLEGCEAKEYEEDVTIIQKKALEDALKKFPDNPEINYYQAAFLKKTKGSMEQRIQHLMKAVDGRPEKKQWRKQLMEILSKTKETKKFMIKYLLLELEEKETIEKMEEIAQWYESFERWEEAIDIRKKMMERNPQHGRLLEPLQKLSRNAKAETESFMTRKKKLQQIIKLGDHMHQLAFEIATQLEKDYPQDARIKVLRIDAAWMNYSMFQKTKQQYYSELQELREQDPGYWRIYFLRGCCYQDLEDFRKANELKPKCYRILVRLIPQERKNCSTSQNLVKDYEDYFQVSCDYTDLPRYISLVKDLEMWKKAIDGIELAKKVGMDIDSMELEDCKKHLQLDEDIEKNPSLETYEARGNYWATTFSERAKMDYLKALEFSPNNSALCLKIAKLCNRSESLQYLNKAIEADPQNAEAYYERALITDSVEDAERACELKPDNLEYLEQLKTAYKNAQRLADAIGVVKKLIKRAPPETVPSLKTELGDLLLDEGQWNDAAVIFKEIGNEEFASTCYKISQIMNSIPAVTSENCKQVAELYQQFAELAHSMAKAPVALKLIRNLAEREIFSSCAEFWGVVGYLCQKDWKTTAEGRDCYKKAHLLDPQNPKWILGQLESNSIFNASTDEQEEFIDLVFKSHELGGNVSQELWRQTRLLCQGLRKTDLAHRAYEHMTGDTEQFWTEKGYFYASILKKDGDALSCHIRACELNPTSAGAWNNRALVLNKIGDYTEAFRCAQKSIELDPYFANPYATVAMIYASQGKLYEARQYAQKSIAINCSVSRGYFVLGLVMEQKQQFHEALVNYDKFLELGHPDGDLIDAAKEAKERCKNRIAAEEKAAQSPSEHEGQHYHLFLSHYQRTGGLLAMVLKLLLEQADPTLKIFLDVDDLENIHDLMANVRNTDTIALLITEGVFERRFVLEEITSAMELGKNIILIWDKERCPWPDPKIVPEHLHKVLLVRAIIWNAEKDFRKVVVQQIRNKITRSDSHNASSAHSVTPQQVQGSVSTEQYNELKNAVHQQTALIQKQNELLQQSLTQQSQMFEQLQANYLHLQHKVENLESQSHKPTNIN